MRLTEMTDEELQKVSLMKNRKGCATQEALRAQRMLRQRHNSFVDCGSQVNFSQCDSYLTLKGRKGGDR